MMSLKYLTVPIMLALAACAPTDTATQNPSEIAAEVQTMHPDWSKDAVIYQINTRQYSEAGDFASVKADLPRIKSLGVDILWFMPIHPIGEAKRKGSLGSPYAVKDFQAVNPELGTLEDFKSLVDAAHAMDMKVIIDWVANHTAWDNHLMTQHPEWYTRNAEGEMQHPPETDWFDVADLDYSQDGLRDYMTESLIYWVKEVGIDGYRCDVAGMVPTDFWNSVRPKLDAVKPVFMLAEWQEPELHEAFDASYAWRWKEIMQDIVNGKAGVSDMAGYYADYQSGWPKGAMRMAYTSNHDQNTWDGTPMDIYGEALDLAMALQFTGDGIPLIYNGQEAGNDKRLEFFEKDLIRWNGDHRYQTMFRDLVELKTNNPALHNAPWGARLQQVENDNSNTVFSFVREAGDNKVLGIFNLSGEPQKVSLSDKDVSGDYKQFRTGEVMTMSAMTDLSLEPWGYYILTQN